MASRPVEQLPAFTWFAVAFAGYVALGVTLRSAVLNWIIGPLWLFLTLWLVPTAWRALRTRTADG